MLLAVVRDVASKLFFSTRTIFEFQKSCGYKVRKRFKYTEQLFPAALPACMPRFYGIKYHMFSGLVVIWISMGMKV